MSRIILFLLVLAAIYFIRKKLTGTGSSASASKRSSSQDSAPRIESVLPCTHCGVLVPQSEGTMIGQSFYCSPEHARLGRSANSFENSTEKRQ